MLIDKKGFCNPSAENIAKEITKSVSIPTIGIGAGPYCDGQVLVIYDLLGLFDNVPKFVKKYAELSKEIKKAVIELGKDLIKLDRKVER